MNHSIKLRNTASRCVVKKKRASSKEKSVLIRNASQLLEAGQIGVDDFLEHIASFKDNKLNQPSKRRNSVPSDDEDSENDEEESPLSQPPKKRQRLDSVNLCRACKEKESNVMTLPCAHVLICIDCWTVKTLTDDKYCIDCFEEVTQAKKISL